MAGPEHKPLVDLHGKSMELRREHILSGCGPDGKPLDPATRLIIGEAEDRRETTLGAVAAEFYKISPEELSRYQLCPSEHAERYQALDARYFRGGDPERRDGTGFMAARRIDDVLAMVEPEQLATGDDTAQLKALMQYVGMSAASIEAQYENLCPPGGRVLVVPCANVAGVVRRDLLPPDTEVFWEQAPDESPNLVVDGAWHLAPAGVATVVIEPGEQFGEERVRAVYPGIPVPERHDLAAELMARGYAPGDVIPDAVLDELGVGCLHASAPNERIPTMPSQGMTVEERMREALAYDAGIRAAREQYTKLHKTIPSLPEPSAEAFPRLRSHLDVPDQPLAQRIEFMTYSDGSSKRSDVRESVAPDGSACLELDGQYFRELDGRVQAWAPELPARDEDRGAARDEASTAQWLPVYDLKGLAGLGDPDERERLHAELVADAR